MPGESKNIVSGESDQNQRKSNEYFTAAVIGVVILAVITWLTIVFFDRELLLLFGAEETLLPLARRYLFPVKFVVPSFLFTQLMAAFLRNDGNPGLATKAVLFGGIFNVFGDYFFVFVLRMGIMGAGLATAMGILTMLFNRQILKYALGTAAVFGMIWTALAVFAPNLFVRIFMTPTAEILIMILPALMGANAIWFAMPITELLVAIYVAMRMMRYTKAICEKEKQVE